MKKIETWCPVFSGFYNTSWEADFDSELYNLNEDSDHEIVYDDLNFDNFGYEHTVAKKFVEIYEKKIKKIFLSIKSIKFQTVVSPKEYNFTNDGINIEVHCDDSFIADIQRYLAENKEKYNEYLKNRYTSCDGFISSHPNYYEGWVEKTKNFTDLENHYLGSILQFIAINENHNNELNDYYYEIMEDSCLSEFITIKEKVKN